MIEAETSEFITHGLIRYRWVVYLALLVLVAALAFSDRGHSYRSDGSPPPVAEPFDPVLDD